jgi:hypothetical protein
MKISELLKKHPSQWTDADIQLATDEETRRVRAIAEKSGNAESYINGLEAGHSIGTHYVLKMVRNYLS